MRILVRVTLICAGLICLRVRSGTVCTDNNPLKCPDRILEPNIRNNRPTGFRRYRVFGTANKRLRTPNTLGQNMPRAQSASVQSGTKLSPTSLPVVEIISSTTARTILSIAPTQTSENSPSSSTVRSVASTIPSITTTKSQVPETTTTSKPFPTLITSTINPTLAPVIDPKESSKAFGPKLHDAAGKGSKFNSDKLLVGPVGGGDNADPTYLAKRKVGLPPNTDAPHHRHPTGAVIHNQNQPLPPPRGPVPDDGQGFGSANGNGYKSKQNYENSDGYDPQNRPKNTGYDEHGDDYSSHSIGQIPMNTAAVGYDDSVNHYGPSNHENVGQPGYGPMGTGQAKPGYYGRPGPGEDGYSGSTPFNQPEIKKPGEKTESEEAREREEAMAERNKVNPKLIGGMSRFSTHSIRTGPQGNSAKLISANYYYPPKKDLPLPKCFYNGDGYVCCSLELNELMVNVYKSLQADPHFHTCNIGAVTSAVQRHAEEKFDTPFEAITGFEDYAQKIHFSGELVCKIEIDGKFILAYATPYNAEEAFDANVDDPSKLPADLSAPLGNKTVVIRNPRFRRHGETNTVLLGPKIKSNNKKS
ncbi:unnamed protein product [Bursaphelenchus xylophilus]|uniref:(pine wood nematode) hypothetical protein n=1 Tax=Bursaphelenchus xylophilus TaxID=6326 RepID=A0A1I7RNB0_BURXY|nr:unnamed protein product [Bursaphelenchus xylophilus]CAG9123827.1 unnamed protein product [Bursaphelenchus xylophilus]